MKSFKVRRYHIYSDKIQHSLKGIFVSDLHNCEYGADNESLIQAIHKEKPDLILTGGDIIVGKPGIPMTGLNFLIKLAKNYPVYSSNGNHEARMERYPEKYKNMYREYEEVLYEHGVHLLRNQKIQIQSAGNTIVIAGLEIPALYYQRFSNQEYHKDQVEEVLDKKNQDAFTILLAHNPVHFEAYAGWGADLTLSGHLHGGIIRLPFLGGMITPQVKMFPKYDRGLYRIKESQMIVSAGLGGHGANIRVFNPPELLVIQIDPSK